MKIDYHKNFIKDYKKIDFVIRDKFKYKLSLFIKNPFLKELNNHSLNWKYIWKRSINITWDFRAIFKDKSDWKYEFIEFVRIWTHSKLYK